MHVCMHDHMFWQTPVHDWLHALPICVYEAQWTGLRCLSGYLCVRRVLLPFGNKTRSAALISCGTAAPPNTLSFAVSLAALAARRAARMAEDTARACKRRSRQTNSQALYKVMGLRSHRSASRHVGPIIDVARGSIVCVCVNLVLGVFRGVCRGRHPHEKRYRTRTGRRCPEKLAENAVRGCSKRLPCIVPQPVRAGRAGALAKHLRRPCNLQLRPPMRKTLHPLAARSWWPVLRKTCPHSACNASSN